METISIDRNIQVFKKAFEAESRIIFSAKFGDGKSYFLKKFMESYPVPIAIQQMSVRRCKEFLDIDIDASLREKKGWVFIFASPQKRYGQNSLYVIAFCFL